MNIMLYAWTMRNLGDDLFVKTICNRYPKHKFYLMDNPKNTLALKDIPNLHLITVAYGVRRIPFLGEKLRDLIWGVVKRKCACAVLIGGSLYIEPSTDEEIRNQIRQRKKEWIEGKPFYVIGANFGPFRKKEYLESYNEYFQGCTDVCFRDSFSYNLFKKGNNIRWAPDILLGNEVVKPTTICNKCNKNIIGVSCIYNDDRYGTLYCDQEEYVNKIVEILRRYIKEGFYVRLLSFCIPQHDTQSCDEIYEKLNNNDKKYCEICEYSWSMEFIINKIIDCDFIIATRFHAAILSLALDIPVYPIIYSLKTLNALVDYGFEGRYCMIDSIQDLTFEDVDSNRIKQYSTKKIHENRKLSDKQFFALDNILN